MSAVSNWLQTWWLRVPTPREFSVAYTVAYFAALAMGVLILLWPPQTVSAELGGPAAIMSVGILLVVGAPIGMMGGALEHWKLERIGLWFMSGALGIYWLVVLALQLTQTGNRYGQLGGLFLGLMLFLVRWLMIRRFTFRPRG